MDRMGWKWRDQHMIDWGEGTESFSAVGRTGRRIGLGSEAQRRVD